MKIFTIELKTSIWGWLFVLMAFFAANTGYGQAFTLTWSSATAPSANNNATGSAIGTAGTGASSGGFINRNNWPATSSLDPGKYYEIVITPSSASFNNTITGISVTLASSGTGPTRVRTRISNNNFSTFQESTERTIGAVSVSFTANNLANSLNPVKIRIYGYLASGTTGGGTMRINALSVTGTTASATAPEINIKEGATSYAVNGTLPNFGSAVQGTVTDKIITIENTGNAALTISTVTLTGANSDEFSIISAPSSVAASSSVECTLRYNRTTVGSHNATVTFNNNDANEGAYTLNLAGTSEAPVAEINIQESAIDIASGGDFSFGSGVQNTTTEKTFTIQNTGNINLDITSITSSSPTEFTVSNIPTVVTPGGTATFTVTYNRSTVDANHTGIITINNNDGNEGTYTINVSGTSTSAGAPAILVSQGIDELTAGSGNYNFGALVTGTSNFADFTLTNGGGATLNISSITSSNPTEFTISSAPSTVAQDGGTAIFRITYNRIAGGLATSTITVNSNATPTAYTFTVNGEALIPAVNVTLQAATAISTEGATLNATRTDENGPTVTAQGFILLAGNNPNITLNDVGVQDISITPVAGAYTANASSLEPNTEFTVRTYTVVSNGCACTTYSTANTFTTLRLAPTTNATAVNITPASATAAITLAGITGAPDGILVFVSTSSTFTAPVNGTPPGTASLTYTSGQRLVANIANPGTGTVNVGTVTGLSAATTYFVATYTYNNSGTGILYSEEPYIESFQTTLPADMLGITAFGVDYTQNFNGMVGNTLPENWRVHRSGSPSWSSATTTGITQSAGSGTPTAGALFRWFTGTDNAVGVMTSGGFASPSSYLAQYRNISGGVINKLNFAFNLERYRRNTAAASVSVFYSTNGSTWVSAGTLNATPALTTTLETGSNIYGYPLNTSAVSGSYTIPGGLANNTTFYMRVELSTTGSNSQGIGIDDWKINAEQALPQLVIERSGTPVTSPTFYDFGADFRDVSSNVTYTIRNTGTLALAIDSVVVSDTAEFAVNTLPTSIAINGSTNLVITYKRKTIAPAQTGTIIFYSKGVPTAFTFNLSGFSEDPNAPAITLASSPVSTFSQTTAVYEARRTDRNNPIITRQGFIYIQGTATNIELNTPGITLDTLTTIDTGTYFRTVATLTPGTTYTMRPFATVSNAGNRTFYGLGRTFTTDKFAPTTSPEFGTITPSATSISVNMNGLASADGIVVFISNDSLFADPVNTIAPATPNLVYNGTGAQVVAYNTSQGNFNFVVSNLNSGQEYYFKAFALNNTGNKTLYNISTPDSAKATTTIPADILAINAVNTAISEGFNGNSSTLPSNWKVISAASNSVTWGIGGTGLSIVEASGGSTTGGTRKWGRNGSFTDGAVGVMSSGSTPSQPTSFLGGFINRTGESIKRIDFSFNLERYRGGNSASFNLYYSTNGSTWTVVPTANYTSTTAFMTASDNVGAFNFINGPSLAVKGNFTPASLIAPNVTFYLRAELNITGSNGKGVGIDDFTVNLKPDAPELLLSVQNVSVPNLTAVPEVDFGTLGQEVTNTRKVSFVNNGTQPLEINSLNLSDTTHYRVQTNTPATVAVGDSLVFNILAKRKAVGTLEATLTVNSNNFNPAIFTIPLKSEATPTSTLLQLGALADANINHTVSTETTATRVLSFNVIDDQLDNSVDTLKTQIERLIFLADVGNTIPNFLTVFGGAILVANGDTARGAIFNNRIEFNSISNATSNTIGWVSDDATKAYELKVWFQENLADSIKTTYDNRRLVLIADVSDALVSANSSAFKVGSISSGVNQNKINIVGTELQFFAQPQSTLVNTNLATVIVDVVDNKGFRDLDINTGDVSIAAVDLVGTPVLSTVANGAAAFEALNFSAAGIDKRLTASYTGFGDKLSDSFNIVNPANPVSYFKFTAAADTNFNNFNNWLVSIDNTTFEPSSMVPTATALGVVIEAGKKAGLFSNVSFNSVTIEEGALLATNGFNLTILNTATDTSLYDLIVRGTLDVLAHNALVMNENTKIQAGNGATLRFRMISATNLFMSTSSRFFTDLDSSSNFELLNMTGTAGPNLRAVFPEVGNIFIQGNHTTALNFSGNIPKVIKGNIEISAPANLAHEIRLASSGVYTANVAGNFIVSRGAFNFSNGSDNKVFTIKGNLIIRNGARFYGANSNPVGNRIFVEGDIISEPTATFTASNATNYYIVMSGDREGRLNMQTDTFFIPGLEIAKTNGAKVTLISDAYAREITFVSGNIETGNFNLDVTSSVIGETASSKLVGNFTTTRSASQGNTANFSNLGLTIRALGANPGQFTIRRSNSPSVVVVDPADADNRSARRRFSITNYNNAGSLNATAVFSYSQDELNGIDERDITLARSTDNGLTWLKINRSSVTVDTVANTITITGVQEFSEWTFQSDDNAPLPVNLSYFQAKRGIAGANDLIWQTSAEVQNAGFNIERSADGKTFEQIAFVKGAGNSNRINNYAYTDVKGGAAYYRLAQLDFDGKVNYSPVVFVSEQETALTMAVYPNPIIERAMLSLQNTTENEELYLQLSNSSGQVVAQTKGYTLELATWFESKSIQLTAGVYVLQLQHNKGVERLKVVKK